MEVAFRNEGVPVRLLGDARSKKQLRLAEARVKLMTMHSSKGLEFPVVAMAGIGYMPSEKADKSSEAKLLYVAMTRATEKLLITSHRRSEFFVQLQEAQSGEESDPAMPGQ